ncbi:bifunctional alpha/beta hydrolase/OsmC family protein [Candidatus Uabimicrobium amorphum]|uniref:Osmotically inducible protein C n=1 Tax=Uabimicrobium amorphum TaxID=2596890 RepID=A0A5S9F5W6_UABAM|nr:bifunctional alpha/beta hydrolase/OsmC family protein [Candidatus Uabimicrobium amorphum]BBM86553.1 osmotically inducible protein C [Candidatus Uabimicrobium amorphum]
MNQKYSFQNCDDETLSATLDAPENPTAYALFAHCFTCSKNLNAVHNITEALKQRGIATLRFDFTGLGQSEGDFSDTNFSSNVDDLIEASKFMEKNLQAPQLLIGHSLGGAAVLQAAAQISSVKAIATIGAPYEPSYVKRLLQNKEEEINRDGEAQVMLAGRKFRIKKQFLDDLDQHKMKDTIRNLQKALLIFHSPSDEIVDISNATQIFQAALHPKSFVSLDAVDHLVSQSKDAMYVGDTIASWASRYLDASMQDSKEDADPRVVVSNDSGFRCEVKVGKHSMGADEPIAVGGGNTGPTPYDYLLSALGTCTAMTIRMYVDRKKWPLEKVRVKLAHKKIHASDCEHCETKEGKVDRIYREIELIGDLQEEERQRCLKIADKCPVHRTLHSEIDIATKLCE